MSNNHISFASEANFSRSTGNILGSNNVSTNNSYNGASNSPAAREPQTGTQSDTSNTMSLNGAANFSGSSSNVIGSRNQATNGSYNTATNGPTTHNTGSHNTNYNQQGNNRTHNTHIGNGGCNSQANTGNDNRNNTGIIGNGHNRIVNGSTVNTLDGARNVHISGSTISNVGSNNCHGNGEEPQNPGSLDKMVYW